MDHTVSAAVSPGDNQQLLLLLLLLLPNEKD